MIEETATVVSCEGDLAEVKTERPTACGSCTARQGCGTALLARVLGNREPILRVANPIHAQPGERVVIGVPESGLVLASLLLYLVWLIYLIGMAPHRSSFLEAYTSRALTYASIHSLSC